MGQDNEKEESPDDQNLEKSNEDIEYTKELLDMFGEPSLVDDKEYRIYLKQKKNLTLKNVKILNETLIGKKECGVSITNTKFDDMEDKMIDAVIVNCSSWFPKKNISEDFIHDKFSNHDKRHNIIPLEKLGRLSCFNQKKEKIDVEHIDTGNNVDIVLEIYGLTFGKKEWKIIYKISQIRQIVEEVKKEDYLFDDEESEDDTEDFF